MEYLRIGTELVAGFFTLFIIIKILGKTQISQITPFDFLSALVLGELVGNAIYQTETGALQIVFALVVWGSLLFIMESVNQRILKTRGFMQGKPSIIIRQGVIDRYQLNKNKINIDQLQTLLRQKSVFSIREVDYAILETNGGLSVLKKSNYDTPKKKDLLLPPEELHLPYTLISDGKVLKENLYDCGLNEEWLLKQLSARGLDKAQDVFFAEWSKVEGLYLVPYQGFSYDAFLKKLRLT